MQPATATVTRTCVRQITLYLVVTHEHGSIENENAATARLFTQSGTGAELSRSITENGVPFHLYGTRDNFNSTATPPVLRDVLRDVIPLQSAGAATKIDATTARAVNAAT